MPLAFKLFWAVTAVELLLWLVPSLRWRRSLSPLILMCVTGSSIGLFAIYPSIATGVVLLISGYRVCNLWRLMKARINKKYLERVSLQSSVWTIGLQAIVLLLWRLSSWLNLSTHQEWLILVCVDCIGAMVLFSSTFRHILKTQPPKLPAEGIANQDLPTLTVAIPARNETDDLEACLRSLMASDYPKLEVLVLDDCSQSQRTPEIIRSFAHDGVRFIQGTEPEENWLAKNQAYQRLTSEANGSLLLFCGVDVRFEPSSLRELVLAMLHKRKSMISVIPNNSVPAPFSRHDAVLLQPMRYAWELALPRRLFRLPPVLSTCWIIKRELLESAGGFAAVSRSIVPESYFARASAVHDGYSFMQSSDAIAISTHKSFSEQRATTIRVRYPQVHRRMELVALVTLAELGGLIVPYILLIVSLVRNHSLVLTLVSLVTSFFLTYVYASIVAITYRRWLVRALVLLPAAVLLDIVLLNYSMLRYEFFSVLWKNRNVCIPVMRVIDPSTLSELTAKQA